MTEQEVLHLKETLPRHVFNKYDNVWIKAFAFYTEKSGQKLGMNCSPCYLKVYNYISTIKND